MQTDATPPWAAASEHPGEGVPFARALAAYDDRLAVVTPEGSTLTYRELAGRVSELAKRLGTTRKLVLVAASNNIGSLVAYLASLHGGHPVVLASADDQQHLDSLVTQYDPDAILSGDGEDWHLHERRVGSAHALHPELALLLSTSGSTGSPKLVRLSAKNLQANASAIADYLDIRDTDRAALSLPMHYAYGLSVINSNLLRGAAILLTGDSVVDPEFWSFFRRNSATSLHGVPYTFELLDGIGFEDMELPSLRYLTQAGGRLAPECVRRYAHLAECRGWRLYVMYGQTEATARMAYLAPELASAHPTTIGVPIPGGSFEIRPFAQNEAENDEGELIYRGPNVMLGYATSPADLALGRTINELATGDIARRTSEGLYEIVGRTSRFLKLFGQRIDLQQAEELLADNRHPAACTGTDNTLIAAVTCGCDPRQLQEILTAHLRVPPHCLDIRRFTELPRLANGKIDYPAIRDDVTNPASHAPTQSVRALFAAVFPEAEIADDATFVSLGGDSLSYVYMSIQLERLFGCLPDTWPTTAVRELEALEPKRRWLLHAETNLVLRALAIMGVVGTHVAAFHVPGGAHLLLALSGFSFARFALAPSATSACGPRILRSTARIAIPAMLWIAGLMATNDAVGKANLFLVNNVLQRSPLVVYWYVEVLVQLLLVLALVFSIPAVARFEQRRGFTTAAIALSIALVGTHYADISSGFPEHALSTHGVAWFFVLGWLAQRSTTPAQKLAVLGLVIVLIPGYFDEPVRDTVVEAGLLLLILLPRIKLPRLVVSALGLVASSSLYIFLTHYAMYPRLLMHFPPAVTFVICLAIGIGAWVMVHQLTRAAGHVRLRRHRSRSAHLTGADERRARRAGDPARSHRSGEDHSPETVDAPGSRQLVS